jgi:hypothetical protein
MAMNRQLTALRHRRTAAALYEQAEEAIAGALVTPAPLRSPRRAVAARRRPSSFAELPAR